MHRFPMLSGSPVVRRVSVFSGRTGCWYVGRASWMPHGRAVGHGIEDHHSGDRTAVFLLLGCIDTVCLDIDGETVHVRFDRDILQLAEVVGIILLKHGDGA